MTGQKQETIEITWACFADACENRAFTQEAYLKDGKKMVSVNKVKYCRLLVDEKYKLNIGRCCRIQCKPWAAFKKGKTYAEFIAQEKFLASPASS